MVVVLFQLTITRSHAVKACSLMNIWKRVDAWSKCEVTYVLKPKQC